MKRHFFKTSLSAFAFTLAIVASFAFSPAPNNAEDVAIQGYIQTLDPTDCVRVNHECIFDSLPDCTVTIFPAGGPASVYETKSGTTCSDQLSRPF